MIEFMNILLAEDDKNFGFILKNELEIEKYVIDHVTNGVDAVINFVSKAYNMVLLDLRMPRLDGLDALKIIKRINPNVPVISFSGNASQKEMAQTLEWGAVHALRKPFEISLLKDEIRDHILR